MGVSLSVWVAGKKRSLFEELRAGRSPSEGEFDLELWEGTKTKGGVQMGTTRFFPDSVVVEFVYPDPLGASLVLPVRLSVPERVVFLPVPDWVVETIWQGEIDGSFRFEGEAREMLSAFAAELEPEANLAHFGARAPRRKD